MWPARPRGSACGDEELTPLGWTAHYCLCEHQCRGLEPERSCYRQECHHHTGHALMRVQHTAKDTHFDTFLSTTAACRPDLPGRGSAVFRSHRPPFHASQFRLRSQGFNGCLLHSWRFAVVEVRGSESWRWTVFAVGKGLAFRLIPGYSSQSETQFAMRDDIGDLAGIDFMITCGPFELDNYYRENISQCDGATYLEPTSPQPWLRRFRPSFSCALSFIDQLFHVQLSFMIFYSFAGCSAAASARNVLVH